MPRAQAESKEVAMKDIDGYARRAHAAHQNGWEAMILWGMAVFLGHATGVEQEKMDSLAGMWIASRLLYNPVYICIKNRHLAIVRTMVFSVGTYCSFRLMTAAALKASEK